MIFRYFLFFTLLFAILHADATSGPTPDYFEQQYVEVTGDNDISEPSYGVCSPNFNDSFYVKVLDANLRPVEGAWISIHYQYSYTFGNKYTYTNPGKSDATGRKYFVLQNQEPYQDLVDCNIVVYATFDDSINATSIIAENHADPVNVHLSNLYLLTIFVKDESGSFVQNATVSVANQTRQSDSLGSIKVWATAGDRSFLASYKKAKLSGQISIDKDTTYEIRFKKKSYSIELIDDNGLPLQGTVTISGKSFQLDNNGIYYCAESWEERIDYVLEYMGINKSGTIALESENTSKVVFDTHAPVISNITYSTVNEYPRLTITSKDSGKYGSGVNPSSISVKYKKENSAGDWSTVQVFTQGTDTWIADFPKLSQNTVIDFRIELKDMAGNKAVRDGKFVTEEQQPKNESKINTETQKEDQGIPLLHIISGIIIIIIILFLVFRLKASGQGGGS
jgi:hypothetical protein